MTELQERARRRLKAIVEQYAAGEAEVVRAYFSQPRTNEEHLEMLLKQMGREIQVRKWMGQAGEMARELERTTDRHSYQELLRQVSDEVQHYVLLADLAEWLAGGPLPADRLLAYEVVARYRPDRPEEEMYNPRLPAANHNLDVGRQLITALEPERGSELMHLAEGGGGGAFVECSRVTGDEFRDRLGATMRSIVRDELRHGPDRIDAYVDRWIQTEEQLETDAFWLKAFMAGHLRVRNEIWGHPLPEERLAAIDRGEVAPLAAAEA